LSWAFRQPKTESGEARASGDVNFLGFNRTSARKKPENRGFSVDRKTIRKRLSAKLKAYGGASAALARAVPSEVVGSVVQGYFNYHAVPQHRSLQSFRAQVVWHWSRALQRRSQKSRMPWERFGPLVARGSRVSVILHPRLHALQRQVSAVISVCSNPAVRICAGGARLTRRPDRDCGRGDGRGAPLWRLSGQSPGSAWKQARVGWRRPSRRMKWMTRSMSSARRP